MESKISGHITLRGITFSNQRPALTSIYINISPKSMRSEILFGHIIAIDKRTKDVLHVSSAIMSSFSLDLQWNALDFFNTAKISLQILQAISKSIGELA